MNYINVMNMNMGMETNMETDTYVREHDTDMVMEVTIETGQTLTWTL